MSRLEIRPPAQFHHAGQLASTFDTADPRQPAFGFDAVEVDLRHCDFVRPPALLWCVVFLALARNQKASCRLLVPQNMGVSAFMKSAGAFDLLRSRGVEVDDRSMSAVDPSRTVLPITSFADVHGAEQMVNRAHVSLSALQMASVNTSRVVAELFSELANNAAEHSNSPVGAFGWINVVEIDGQARFSCVVADGGIGVRQSLAKNPVHGRRVSYDWDALERATRERVSGTSNPHRGIGLWSVADDARELGATLFLHSGIGSLEVSADRESKALRTRLFPGTLAYLSLPA
jgi:hypothetical protein